MIQLHFKPITKEADGLAIQGSRGIDLVLSECSGLNTRKIN